MDVKDNKPIIAKITSKNQITIPKEIRNKLNLGLHDSVEFIENKDGSYSMERKTTKDFWSVVDEQEKKYGNISTPEISWGEDVESEDFD